MPFPEPVTAAEGSKPPRPPVAILRSSRGRVRKLNATAPILRSSHARVELDEILGIGAFSVAQTMAIAPDFLDDHGHQHDPSLQSVSLAYAGSFDRARLESHLKDLLKSSGDDHSSTPNSAASDRSQGEKPGRPA